MKRLVPTEFELSLEADRDHAARGAAMHKQKPLAVNIQDDKQRIRELERGIKKAIAAMTGENPSDDPNKYPDEVALDILQAILKGAK